MYANVISVEKNQKSFYLNLFMFCMILLVRYTLAICNLTQKYGKILDI